MVKFGRREPVPDAALEEDGDGVDATIHVLEIEVREVLADRPAMMRVGAIAGLGAAFAVWFVDAFVLTLSALVGSIVTMVAVVGVELLWARQVWKGTGQPSEEGEKGG